MKENFKLAIALPLTDDKVYASFLDSFILLDKPSYTYLRPQFPGNIDAIRNNLVTQALDENCTHLFLTDTDQTLPTNTLIKLISHNLDIVTAKVHRRYPPFDPILMRWDDEAKQYYSVADDEWVNKDLVEVDATGAACMLINMDVFRKIPAPWFKFDINEHGKPVGEDIYFCKQLKKAGYKIFVDTSIKVGHLANLIVTEGTYNLYKGLKRIQEAQNSAVVNT